MKCARLGESEFKTLMDNARPNIILILTDDLGWRDLACYGSTFYETPHLDRLAAEGMTFTDAYAASPVCSPARASILTGKYPARVGVTDWIDWNKNLHPCRGRLVDAPYVDHLPLTEKSLAAALREAGYQTWHVGKWHLGESPYQPENHGFEVNIGGCHWGSPRNGYFSPWGLPNLAEGPAGEYLTDRLTDEAIRLIRARGDRPFFLNLWHYAVHNPMQAKAEDTARFTAKAHALGLDRIQPFAAGEFFPCEHKKHQRVTRRLLQSDPVYAAMVYNLDWNIGRLLRALAETGKAGETLVIFTSDNGGLATSEGSPTCNKPLSEGKGWMYEGGVRVPLIAWWPGAIRPGSICRAPVTSPDFYPTFMALAGEPRPEQLLDGVSLVPLFGGAAGLERDALYWHYPHYGNQGGTPGSSVRMGDYKLIEFFEDGRCELYHLQEDPGEERNLAEDQPGLVAQMRQILAAWRENVGARVPERNPQYGQAERVQLPILRDDGGGDKGAKGREE